LASEVTEPMIREVMDAFYARARGDPELGPIFDRQVTDWDAHLRRVCDFWAWRLLGTTRYRGAPVAVHARIAELRPVHFARWLELFQEVAATTCPPVVAERFIRAADAVAGDMIAGMEGHRRIFAPLGWPSC
jgi:hemoglobin